MNGKGIYTDTDGDVYEGEYEDDIKSGTGTYTYADGDKYIGQFKNNDINGKEIMTYSTLTVMFMRGSF